MVGTVVTAEAAVFIVEDKRWLFVVKVGMFNDSVQRVVISRSAMSSINGHVAVGRCEAKGILSPVGRSAAISRINFWRLPGRRGRPAVFDFQRQKRGNPDGANAGACRPAHSPAHGARQIIDWWAAIIQRVGIARPAAA